MAGNDVSTELKELQNKNLELIKYFSKICNENGLRFYLCGGGCIGAVRHGGFIPWDDDIDVFMPRPDYERLRDVWKNSADKRYVYSKTDKNEYTRLQFAAVCDTKTTFIKTRQCDLDIPHGVRIDILPLDGCPTGRFARKMQILWALLYSMFIVGEPHTSKGRLPELLGKAALFFFRTPKARYRVWRFAEKRMSKYDFDKSDKVTELCAWYQYMVNEYPKSAFEQAIYLPFEDTELPVMNGYDTYLKMAFGDYMQLPSEDKRVPTHEVVWFDLDKPYTQYKGIYYCND